MPKELDFDNVVCKLREILEKHKGMPAQRVDSNAYQFARRYIKRYIDEPEIKELIREFNITFRRTPEQAYKEKTILVKAILEGKEHLPYTRTYKELILKNYFWRYKDDETAKMLKFKYAHEYAQRDVIKSLREHNLKKFTGGLFIDWKFRAAYTIIVYNNYNILPIFIHRVYEQALEYEKNQNILVFERISQFYKDEIKIKNQLILYLYKMGCRDEIIVKTYNILNNLNTQTIINNLKVERHISDNDFSALLNIKI